MATKDEDESAGLSNRIRELRKAKGLTLQTLGDRVGLSVQQLSNLELGKRRLNDYWMTEIAEALSVQPRELLAGGGEKVNMSPQVYGAAHDVLTSMALHDLVSLSQHEIDRLSTVMAQVVKLQQDTDEKALRDHIERSVVDLQDYRTIAGGGDGAAGDEISPGRRGKPRRHKP